MRRRIRPYKGKWCSRKTANEINDALQSAYTPDRTALKKEAEEYAAYLRAKRVSRTSHVAKR